MPELPLLGRLAVRRRWREALLGDLEALLFEVERGDPATFAGVIAILGVVALGAGWLPAWRATRIDPCRALADE